MKSEIGLALAASLLGLTACDRSPTTPTSASSPEVGRPPVGGPPAPGTRPDPPPLGTYHGILRARGITPESGSTVPFRNCGALQMAAGYWRAAHFLNICSDDVAATVEVTIDQDVRDVFVVVEFGTETTTCGSARSSTFDLLAGVPAVVTASRLRLHTYQEFEQPEYPVCGLPAVTTRVTVELKRMVDSAALLPPVDSGHFLTLVEQ